MSEQGLINADRLSTLRGVLGCNEFARIVGATVGALSTEMRNLVLRYHPVLKSIALSSQS
jgi:hypothetical protein